MSKAKRVAVVGAGFSGLTLALRLRQQGLQVSLFEAQSRVGGLIQTESTPVIVEAAAHALLASQDVESLFHELGLPWVKGGHRSKSKWIFRGQAPSRWPLTISETIRFFLSLLKAKVTGQFQFRQQESLAQWADRNSFSAIKTWLLGPALQGVYGTSPENLSASLILGSMTTKLLRMRKGKVRGSLAPEQGMKVLQERLAESFKEQGGEIHLNSTVSLPQLQSDYDAVVVASSMKAASHLLQSAAPKLSSRLQSLPMVSLVTSTVAYGSAPDRVKGFGCLFPKNEIFSALGVLFNTDLFANRGPLESETWIFSGDVAEKSDRQICDLIQKDRSRISKTVVDFSYVKIIRWPEVLPLYGQGLESLLESDLFLKSQDSLPSCLQVFAQGARVAESEKPLYLTGNYLGGIGLTKILSYNNRLAEKIYREL